ncbi:hypothetical protein HYDPIDRAFT_112035 [Hydnomerulius pinastri MD-312]|uniref:Uncharacterized protein n=1 Tax=Hydnomerulius pinastri MD-312 TaxID=994086 RepID=A0A0C9W9X9_9AGAM|nr:hypothetical protein HYDPIDRAFT_112035 [Hydnomerulius pinastri MD-312]
MLALRSATQATRLRVSLQGTARGFTSTKSQQVTQSRRGPSTEDNTSNDGGDFRPPWVYTASSFLRYTTIPIALAYCVFLADWGDREHVFMPLRKWVRQHTQSVFSLSPEETALVQQNGTSVPDGSSPSGNAESRQPNP